ncbi:MAG: transposase [Desulfosporosinus sp.]|nr:transposase [Desulfosporosinus sp.]
MARKPRLEYPGALYHVMCRGNNGEYILTEKEKPIYLTLIKKYKERYDFKLYAYCIMDNHVHLLIETGETPLSRIMQGIQQSFTQQYNKKYNRTGHVFQQRYKAQLCDKERYLLQVIKYIHYNPVEAGIEAGLDYQWSSHGSYLYGKHNSLVDLSFVLGIFSENHVAAHKQYRVFMNIKPDKIELKIDEPDKPGDNEINKTIGRDIRIDIDTLIDIVCKEAGVSREEVTRRTKIQKYSDVRKAVVRISEKYGSFANAELARKLNLPPSMVSKIRSGDSKGTQIVDEIIRNIEEKGIIQA